MDFRIVVALGGVLSQVILEGSKKSPHRPRLRVREPVALYRQELLAIASQEPSCGIDHEEKVAVESTDRAVEAGVAVRLLPRPAHPEGPRTGSRRGPGEIAAGLGPGLRRRPVEAGHRQQRGGDVDRASDVAPRPGGDPGRADQAWHVQLARDQASAVSDRAVFTEALAVVGDDDDMGLDLSCLRFEVLEKAAESGIEEGDVGVVESVGALDFRRQVFSRRRQTEHLLGPDHRTTGGVAIGTVGIEIMKPEELAPGGCGVELDHGALVDALGEGIEVFLRERFAVAERGFAGLEVVDEVIEALGEAEATADRKGGDHRRGREAGLAQPLGDRHVSVGQPQPVPRHAVFPGLEAGEHRSVRRLRRGGRRVEALEDRRALGPAREARHGRRSVLRSGEAFVAPGYRG